MFHLWNMAGYRTQNCALLICCFNDSVSLFTQYHVNSISKSIPCFCSKAFLLLGMIHIKTKLATFCMQAYIAFSTYVFDIFLHILQRPWEIGLRKWFILSNLTSCGSSASQLFHHCSNRMCFFFLLKLFAFNKFFVHPFCSVF